MKLVNLGDRQQATTDAEKKELHSALDGLKEQVDSGELAGLVYVGVGGDFVFYGGVNIDADFYRLLGGMDALKQQLLDSIYEPD